MTRLARTCLLVLPLAILMMARPARSAESAASVIHLNQPTDRYQLLLTSKA